ncbi:MAG TPA: low molecular weight protein-tyrosine-phosphatase [Ornithinimicrobium sp.]|nr:low molecular weight protein-tyrosine-phosphatase [Ornithinimicrobium sp.]
MHIMTVCLGNICRSPAAEAVLLRRLSEAGLDHVRVSSAGTADYHVGERPHPTSQAEGERRGYAFTTRAAQLEPSDLARADLVVVMDQANEEDVRALVRRPEDARKVVRLGAFAPGEDGVQDVPDPWGRPDAAYVQMYDQIEEAVDALVAAIADGTLPQILDRHRVSS